MQSRDDGDFAKCWQDEQIGLASAFSTGDRGRAVDRRAHLAYIANLAKELAVIAEGAGSCTLAGLLNVAHLEAYKELRRA